MDDLKDKTWEDDLGEWEHIRFETSNDQIVPIVDLSRDEIRRVCYEKFSAEQESNQPSLRQRGE